MIVAGSFQFNGRQSIVFGAVICNLGLGEGDNTGKQLVKVGEVE